MNIYIDVTLVIRVDFLTGIQRVVRSVVVELLQLCPGRIVLLYSDKEHEYYRFVDSKLFLDHFSGKDVLEDKYTMVKKNHIMPEDINAGDIFFDIDGVWLADFRRSNLLPRLKARGVKLAVFIHDIIPVRYPQFCHTNTTFHFLDYIGAYMQYADLMITSTQSVLDDVYRLADELGTKRVSGGNSWLGSDFSNKNTNAKVDERVKKSLKNKKYVLCVGTIEPRKNLEFVLNSFENRLFSENLCLVFAGRKGWNVDDLVRRMENHSQRGKKFFHFEGLNDASIDYLYKNAMAVAFPTYDEGFGLPIVEAFERGVPVITTDRPVLREVGGEYADYFPLNNEKEFCKCVEKYVNDCKWRDDKISLLKTYKAFTWRQAAEKIVELLSKLEPTQYKVSDDVKQIVILTARADVIGDTLRYIDYYMPFIQEVVLCCPDKMAKDMRSSYEGRLQLKILTDSAVLNGRKLPDDHVKRNTFLRACAILGDELDDVFIMSDDDYRPIKEIRKDYYVSDGRYNGYYCYDLDKWTGNENRQTSYDEGMVRTAKFLINHNLPTRQYSSHMPQIIDKRIYKDLLLEYPEAMTEGYDEWSIYFNYLQNRFPLSLNSKVYQAMCWPGRQTDWDMIYFPDEYCFENYYEDLYLNGELFEGYKKSSIGNEVELAKKAEMYDLEVKRHKEDKHVYDFYCKEYDVENHEMPAMGVVVREDEIALIAPNYITLLSGSFVSIPFFIERDGDNRKIPLEISYVIKDLRGNICKAINKEVIPPSCKKFCLGVYSADSRGKYIFNIRVIVGNRIKDADIETRII